MKQYLDAIKHVLENGEQRDDRTGTGTIGVFGYQTRFDLREGFPAVTTKKLAWKSVVSELLWFLEGSTDERRLAELRFGKPRSLLTDKQTIWTANANEQGVALGYTNNDREKDLGPVYGHQWRNFGGDQIQNVVNGLRTNPWGRRHIVSAWNAEDLDEMALPPCHTMFQFYVSKNMELSCQLYQRSCDLGLGAPFNIASYALLTHIIARELGYGVGEFVYTLGDMHVYSNHVEGLKLQLEREPLPLPTLHILDGFKFLDSGQKYSMNASLQFVLEGYDHYESIPLEMAV